MEEDKCKGETKSVVEKKKKEKKKKKIKVKGGLMGFVSIMEGILQNKNYKLYYNTTNYLKIFTIVEVSNLSHVKIK